MTPVEIYQVARGAGFPPETAVTMTAIAMRESGGNPSAYNGNEPDDSYGLWQINMYGNLGPARLVQFGLSDYSQLFDPYVNAAAAFTIWNGNDSNLDAAWYINRPVYKERYEQYLPAARSAAEEVEGMPVEPATGGNPFDWITEGMTSDEKTLVAGAAMIAGIALLWSIA